MASISSTWQTVDCAEPRHFMRMKLACYGWECDLKHHIRSFEFFWGGFNKNARGGNLSLMIQLNKLYVQSSLLAE